LKELDIWSKISDVHTASDVPHWKYVVGSTVLKNLEPESKISFKTIDNNTQRKALKFSREAVLQRSGSTEKRFYREAVLQRSGSTEKRFYREAVLQRSIRQI
jgi:hypothetical protein